MSSERTPKQRAADAEEVKAFRVACEGFFRNYVEEVIKRAGLRALAGSEHEHKTLLFDQSTGEVMLVRVRFDFGDLVDRGLVEELIAAASRAPGSVPES